MRLRVLLLAAVAAAMPIDNDDQRGNDKRAVVLTTTQAVGWAELFGLGQATTSTTAAVAPVVAPTTATVIAATTPVAPVVATAATTAAATTPTTTSTGFWSKLAGFFGLSGSSAAAATPAATPAATTASTSKGWFSNLMLSLFGGSAASSSAAAQPSTSPTTAPLLNIATSASQSVEQPGFTGLVVVEGPTGDSGTEPVASASIALNSQVQKVAAYAEEGAGITYSPYTKSGSCKSASEVASDIQMLRAYGMIRLYSVDCSGIANVVSAMSSLQKLYLGVWSIDNLDTDLLSMAQQVLSGSRGWSAVHTVAIGNELVNAGTKTVAQIKTAVATARAWFKSNASAYSGYIVSVDTLAAVMADASMCDISDYLAVNCHPYFSGIEALTSGTWLQAQVLALKSHCNNGKSVLITESGWPSYGNTVGDAVPLQQNQYLAIKGLGSVMGSLVIMFTTFNDYWKDPGPYNVEQHWGVYGDPSV